MGSVASIGNSQSSRRPAAVAFVDIVGYSILMATDERRTHERWMSLLNEVVRPATANHRGRIVKSTGDGILAEFPSAPEAVEWARAVQFAAGARNERVEEDPERGPTIALRIGLHFCDIIETPDDIYGAGVNVAARLQVHAEPGGIVLSEAVHDLVRGALAGPARDLGLVRLKNFDRPVHAYALDPPRRRPAVIGVPTLGPLPSIAVLPFRNLDGDPDKDYFGDGLVEDIIVSLSGLRELLVIARSSTVTYRQRDPDVGEVGRALGVQYVVTGSVRRSSRLVRVSVHLFDSYSGVSLWGDTTEAPLEDLFEVQDRIAQRIVAGIAPHVHAQELRRVMRQRPESFTAYDYLLRALDVMNKLDLSTFSKAIEFLNQAMADDPSFSMPMAWAARWHSINIGQGWSKDPGQEAEQALLLAFRAIELDRDNAVALATYAHLRSRLYRDFDSALMYFDRALKACPNSSLAWSLSALTLAYVGDAEKAVKHAEHGLRLSPLDNSAFFYYTNLGYAHFAAGNYDEAVKWTSRAASENPSFTANLRVLCAGLAALDRVDEASRVAGQIMNLEPAFGLVQYEQARQPFRDPKITKVFMDYLRKSGLRD